MRLHKIYTIYVFALYTHFFATKLALVLFHSPPNMMFHSQSNAMFHPHQTRCFILTRPTSRTAINARTTREQFPLRSRRVSWDINCSIHLWTSVEPTVNTTINHQVAPAGSHNVRPSWQQRQGTAAVAAAGAAAAAATTTTTTTTTVQGAAAGAAAAAAAAAAATTATTVIIRVHPASSLKQLAVLRLAIAICNNDTFTHSAINHRTSLCSFKKHTMFVDLDVI